jgi:hypothetical protein
VILSCGGGLGECHEVAAGILEADFAHALEGGALRLHDFQIFKSGHDHI